MLQLHSANRQAITALSANKLSELAETTEEN